LITLGKLIKTMPYRKQGKTVIIKKSVDIAGHIRRISRVSEEERDRKASIKADKKLAKSVAKEAKKTAKFHDNFEKKYWPRVIKFLEKYAAEKEGRRAIKLNRIHEAITYDYDKGLTKPVLRRRLIDVGFNISNSHWDDEVSW
jgi:hypothetical protein